MQSGIHYFNFFCLVFVHSHLVFVFVLIKLRAKQDDNLFICFIIIKNTSYNCIMLVFLVALSFFFYFYKRLLLGLAFAFLTLLLFFLVYVFARLMKWYSCYLLFDFRFLFSFLSQVLSLMIACMF